MLPPEEVLPQRVDAPLPPDEALPQRVDAPLPPEESLLPMSNATEPPKRQMGAMRPEQAEAERAAMQETRRVFDPHLGVERLVRLSGEVVEESVSRGEQQRRASIKARHVAHSAASAPESYTGRDKFPSQHKWFGYS